MAAVTFRVASVAANAVASTQRNNDASKRETVFMSTILRIDGTQASGAMQKEKLRYSGGQARYRGTRLRAILKIANRSHFFLCLSLV